MLFYRYWCEAKDTWNKYIPHPFPPQHPHRYSCDIRFCHRHCHNLFNKNNNYLSSDDVFFALLYWDLSPDSVCIPPTQVRVYKLSASARVLRDDLLLDHVCQSCNGCSGSRLMLLYSGSGGKGVVASFTVVVICIRGGGGSDQTCAC